MKTRPLITCIFLLLFITILISCNHDDLQKPDEEAVTFKNYGLENKTINELKLINNHLYAATDDGLYVKDIKSNTGWQAKGLQGKIVKTFLFVPDEFCLASVHNEAKTEYKIYKSAGNQFEFQELATNFGGGYPELLTNFAYKQDTKEVLASGNKVVAKSTDGGGTWVPIYNDWQWFATGLDFIQLNPHTGDIWAGGQNAIEGFSLVKYSKNTSNWQEWSNLLPPPSTAKDIAFAKNNPNTLIIGGEDGIIKTTDNGAAWNIIKQNEHEARFYFGVEFDEENPERIYAASWKKDFTNPQPLIIYLSKNGGSTWQEHQYPDANLFGGVWDMVQTREGDKTRLYLGLYKGGVFEATID